MTQIDYFRLGGKVWRNYSTVLDFTLLKQSPSICPELNPRLCSLSLTESLPLHYSISYILKAGPEGYDGENIPFDVIVLDQS